MVTNREKPCGGRAKSKPGFGAQSMKNPDMKKFIEVHGSDRAKQALKAISGVASRGQMCAIFHMFKAGRVQISLGEGQGAFRLTPSPNRVKKPSPTGSSSSSSPMNIKKSLNVFAFSERKKKEHLRSILKAFRPGLRKNLMMKREHMYGPMVLSGRPPKRVAVSSNSNSNNSFTRRMHGSNGGERSSKSVNSRASSRSSGSGSGSGSSRMNGTGGSLSSNNNMHHGVHFAKLDNKRNVVPIKEKKKTSRFNTVKRTNLRVRPSLKEKFEKKRKRKHHHKKKKFMKPAKGNVTKYPATGKLLRIPTRSIPYHRAGTAAAASNAHLRAANEERWREYKKLVNNRTKMTTGQKSKLANSLLQKAIRNTGLQSSGSASSSSANSLHAGIKRRAKNVRARIMAKLSKRHKPPELDIARMFRNSILSGRQVEKIHVSRKKK
jgi:hypothetical protein